MELLQVKVNILTKGLHCCDQTTSCDEATLLPDGNKRDRYATSAIATQQARSLRNKRKPETAPDKDSSTSKINKTYLDFLDSLSSSEREDFLKFGENRAAELKNPPVQLPQKWIEKNWQELAAQWYKSKGQSPPAQNAKWENHPHYSQWLDKIRNLGFAKFIYENDILDSERQEFYEWANSRNLIWEAES